MTTTASKHVGEWRRLTNLSADRKGSIHDDEAAQALGFRAAFVPGSTVGTAAMPAVVALLGERWFRAGWYTYKFVTPVYTSEDVREEGEVLADGRVDLRVVTPEGRLCCSGQAGYGFEKPWEPALHGKRGAEGALPGLEIGTTFDETEVVFDPAYIERLLAASGDRTGWYRDSSPFGAALVPPEAFQNFALQVTRGRRLPFEGVRNPGMWAEHSLAFNRPLLAGAPYRMREWVADKGVSGRTVFLTYEYEVLEGADVAAIGQHRVKWLRGDM